MTKIKLFLFWPLILLALVGALSPTTYNYLPATLILEGIFFISIMSLIGKYAAQLRISCCILLMYLAYFYLRAVLFNGANVLDVVVATKAFIYLLFIGICLGKNKLELRSFLIIFHTFLLIFLVKYVYSRVFGFSDRPGVFTENNFELVFLMVLAVGVWEIRGNTLWKEVIALITIVGVSGSRSGVLELLFILVFATRFQISRGNVRRNFWPIMLSVLSFLPILYSVFISRSEAGLGLESIDRYNFLNLFLDETNKWSPFDWLTGAKPLTELSNSTCNELSFYEYLFSYKDGYHCYSVIFHSMIIRTIFDHGLIGLFLILYFIWVLLSLSGMGIRVKIGILGILIINGLSVSSFNSVYAALSIALLLLVQKNSNDIKFI